VNQALVKQTTSFSETAIDDEVVLLNLDDGTFFSLTGTAAAIWSLIDGTRDRAAILALLASTYDEAPETIGPELDAFLAQLMAAGFVAHA